MGTTIATSIEPEDERRLEALGLSTEIFHDGLRGGASRAANRSELALESSGGTDIYHDGMEGLHLVLAPAGWRQIPVDQQPRLVHPEGIVSFAISSGVNVGKANMRRPRTGRKGPATRKSLATLEVMAGLFDDVDAELAAKLAAAAQQAPFYFLLCERPKIGGNGLIMEFSQPAGMTEGGSVNLWADRIPVTYLDLEGDLSVFRRPDAGDEYIVSVEPR
jgi:hypothetical protein